MSRNEFLLALDEILDLPPGTLRGHEKLEELKNWDSTSLITFIALADANNNTCVSPGQILNCVTVTDLLRVAQVLDAPPLSHVLAH